MKANQPKLLTAIKQTVAQQAPLETHVQNERSRGRRERRTVVVYGPPSTLDTGWQQVRRVLCVIRSGRREGARHRRVSYYISSREDTAAGFARGIRGHWGIENRLHYVKDVAMNEDTSGIRAPRAAANLAMMRSAALTRYRRAGYDSLKAATVQFANKVKELLQLLST